MCKFPTRVLVSNFALTTSRKRRSTQNFAFEVACLCRHVDFWGEECQHGQVYFVIGMPDYHKSLRIFNPTAAPMVAHGISGVLPDFGLVSEKEFAIELGGVDAHNSCCACLQRRSSSEGTFLAACSERLTFVPTHRSRADPRA